MKLRYFFICSFLVLLPAIVLAQVGDCNSTNTSGTLCNPTNAGTIEGLVGKVMTAAGSVLGLIAIVVLVYAGFRLMTANGDEKRLGEAKSALTYGVAGFVISVLAYAGVLALENFLGVQQLTSNTDVLFNPFGQGTTMVGFVEGVLRSALILSGSVALFMIILNGFRYLTARGDDQKLSGAKKGLTWSLVGLALILLAYVIISALAQLIS